MAYDHFRKLMIIFIANLTELSFLGLAVYNFLQLSEFKLASTLYYCPDLRALERLITVSAKTETLSGGVN